MFCAITVFWLARNSCIKIMQRTVQTYLKFHLLYSLQNTINNWQNTKANRNHFLYVDETDDRLSLFNKTLKLWKWKEEGSKSIGRLLFARYLSCTCRCLFRLFNTYLHNKLLQFIKYFKVHGLQWKMKKVQVRQGYGKTQFNFITALWLFPAACHDRT